MPDDTGVVVRLFAQEVPEIAAGTVEIKTVAQRSRLPQQGRRV